MNKSTKLKLNYTLGGIVSIGLLVLIYWQIKRQLDGVNAGVWRHTGPDFFLYACIAFMMLNLALESLKWYKLVSWTDNISYGRAIASYFSGVAFGLVTPNRVGEYPGRVLYLRTGNTLKYVGVSIAGILSQLGGVYTLGLIGLLFFGARHSDARLLPALSYCVSILALLTIVYWRIDRWLTWLGRWRVFRRVAVVSRLLGRAPVRERAVILTLSILRSIVFTAQFLFLLRWMNVDIPLVEGFCTAALFFWVMAVIPSLALTELGVRGAAGVFLFSQYSDNTIGILAATTGIWVMNIVLPAIPGSVLMAKMKWLR